MLLSPNRNPAFCSAMRGIRTVAERRILSCRDEIGCRRHSSVVEDGVDIGNNNGNDDDDDDVDDDDDDVDDDDGDGDGDDDDDDDNDDAEDDDADADDGDEENEGDSSACKRITLRGRTKTANPVILFQTRQRTAASRKESKRSTTSN